MNICVAGLRYIEHGQFKAWTNQLYRHRSKLSLSKKWPIKGLCGRCLSEFIDWRYIQSCWYFWPNFVNCVAPLTFSLGSSLPPPPPLPCVNKYTVNTYTVCKGGEGMGCWPQRNKHLPQSLFTGLFLDYDILIWCLYSSFAHDLKFHWRNVPVTSSPGSTNLCTFSQLVYCLYSSPSYAPRSDGPGTNGPWNLYFRDKMCISVYGGEMARKMRRRWWRRWDGDS
jgi:hypothetical protein